MANPTRKKGRNIHIRKLLCECIDSLNDPGGSTIIDMIYWIESNKGSLMDNQLDSHCISDWIRELEKERIIFHFNMRKGIGLTKISHQKRVALSIVFCSCSPGLNLYPASIAIDRPICRYPLGDNGTGSILPKVKHFGTCVCLHAIVG